VLVESKAANNTVDYSNKRAEGCLTVRAFQIQSVCARRSFVGSLSEHGRPYFLLCQTTVEVVDRSDTSIGVQYEVTAAATVHDDRRALSPFVAVDERTKWKPNDPGLFIRD